MNKAFSHWYDVVLNKFTYFHLSKRNRKIFSLIYFVWLLVLILFFALSGFLFSLFGVSISSETGAIDINTIFSVDQILELIFGSIIFLITLVTTVISNVLITSWFKDSKENYSKTLNFVNQKANIDKLDLSLQSNKDLKWFYKLGYITKEKLVDQKEYNLNVKKALKEKIKKG